MMKNDQPSRKLLWPASPADVASQPMEPRFAAGAAYVDGQFCPIEEARIPLLDWGFLQRLRAGHHDSRPPADRKPRPKALPESVSGVLHAIHVGRDARDPGPRDVAAQFRLPWSIMAPSPTGRRALKR